VQIFETVQDLDFRLLFSHFFWIFLSRVPF
jgi:hypothetical protein